MTKNYSFRIQNVFHCFLDFTFQCVSSIDSDRFVRIKNKKKNKRKKPYVKIKCIKNKLKPNSAEIRRLYLVVEYSEDLPQQIHLWLSHLILIQFHHLIYAYAWAYLKYIVPF